MNAMQYSVVALHVKFRVQGSANVALDPIYTDVPVWRRTHGRRRWPHVHIITEWVLQGRDRPW